MQMLVFLSMIIQLIMLVSITDINGNISLPIIIGTAITTIFFKITDVDSVFWL